MSNKIVMNGEIVYLKQGDKVVIDKRLEAALEDGDPDFISQYELTPKEEQVVLDLLKKYDRVGEGFPPDIASKIANKIREKERAQVVDQEDVSKPRTKPTPPPPPPVLDKAQEQQAEKLPVDNKVETYKKTVTKIEGDSTTNPTTNTKTEDIKKAIKTSSDKYKHRYNATPVSKPKATPKRYIKPKPNYNMLADKWIKEYSYEKEPNQIENKKPLDLKDINHTIDEFFLRPRDKAIVSNDDLPVDDNSWITDVFMLGKKDIDSVVKDAMFWTTAELKITDTSLGGNVGINNYPQFTRTADIRVMGRRSDRLPVKIESITGDHGMGRYYSEKYDDNVVKCYLEFGVPEFNGIFNYLTSAIDYESAVVANSGRNPLAYKVGNVIGKVAFFAAFPVFSLVYWLGKEILDIVVGPGNFDFYYMKETMPKYWSIVNSLVMMMSTELGMLLPRFDNKNNSNVVGAPLKFDKDDLEYFRVFMPDVITKEGQIDIFAVVTRTQKAVNQHLKQQYSTIKTDSNLKNLQDLLKEAKESTVSKPSPYHEYWDKVKKAYSGPVYDKKEDKNKKATTAKKPSIKKVSANKDGTYSKEIANFIQNSEKWLKNYIEATKASMYGGAEYAVFNVEYLGSSSMSVSNEVGELELQGMLKGIGGKARSIKFNGGAGVLGSLGKIASYAMDTAVGALDGVTLNMTGKLLTMLLGEANLNLPLRWTDSSISLPTHSFKMKLVSPYGNPMSQLINIYIPLASVMAGALPLATGMSSYTSPFLCSMFVRGYQKVNLGMITSLEITKGTTNLPYNKAWKPLGIDVTFTVTDFSKVLALPVGHDLTSMNNVIYDDNNPLNRYIQSLCGRDFKTSTFMVPKLKLRLSRIVDNITIMSKPDYLGMKTGDTLRWLGKMIPFHTELGDYSSMY